MAYATTHLMLSTGPRLETVIPHEANKQCAQHSLACATAQQARPLTNVYGGLRKASGGLTSHIQEKTQPHILATITFWY